MSTPLSGLGDGLGDVVVMTSAPQQIADHIMSSIAVGALPVGSALPPERELAAAMQVSRSSVRAALDRLERGGFIVRRRGRGGGTFVAEWDSRALAGIEDRCVFVNGMSMGRADEGSHPGGAKKLLTNKDGGFGMSVDQFLASTVGGGSPFRHLYLGAMATLNGASGDKFVSYPSAGVTAAPEDDPRRAFGRLFEEVAGTAGFLLVM